MKRFLVAALAAIAFTTSVGDAALAGTKWCVIDPIITVDGRTSDVTVRFQDAYTATVLPPIVFRFHVPSNSTATVSLPTAAVPYTVEVFYDLPARAKRDPVTVRAESLVNATATFTTETFVQLSRNVTVSALGTSGAVTTITYSVR